MKCSFIRLPAVIAIVAIVVVGILPISAAFSLFPKASGKPVIHDTIVPKIALEKTVIKDMNVVYISDTANTTEDIHDVLGGGYVELIHFIQANKLQPVKFIAWYYAMQPPWPVDVAVETNREPTQLSGRIKFRKVPRGEVIIAHTYGPYGQVGQAYMQIEKWLKENNRKAKSAPFEVYVNDPDLVKSPEEIQTDVYQPVE
ncbi:GyrI-like domain-containing protein [Niabella sp. CC-SYL272]|uniref:GyrI-like domain-containing protein n=1 Tax=Niabella agricola TaxID=2891571 RepID=UPI001F232307|nr:GyrI-like domain-containing protein [Niabella agricola]MCF3108716.1 GyrI-like domain-containing protein [Niabella agricola]